MSLLAVAWALARASYATEAQRGGGCFVIGGFESLNSNFRFQNSEFKTDTTSFRTEFELKLNLNSFEIWYLRLISAASAACRWVQAAGVIQDRCHQESGGEATDVSPPGNSAALW